MYIYIHIIELWKTHQFGIITNVVGVRIEILRIAYGFWIRKSDHYAYIEIHTTIILRWSKICICFRFVRSVYTPIHRKSNLHSCLYSPSPYTPIHKSKAYRQEYIYIYKSTLLSLREIFFTSKLKLICQTKDLFRDIHYITRMYSDGVSV